MTRIFTMQKRCPACHTVFTITSAASVYCQNKDCQNKRRRDDYAAAKKAAGERALQPGSGGHLARAIESGE